MAPSVEPDPPPRKLSLKAAEFTRENEPASAPASSTNDPMELLRLNREREIAQGFDVMPPPPPTKRISQRNREYLITLVVGNLLLIGSMAMGGGIFSLAMMALFTAGLTWMMLFVFDDY